MKCPHCSIEFHEAWEQLVDAGSDKDGIWTIRKTACPRCKRMILELECWHDTGASRWVAARWPVRPRTVARAPLSSDVPDHLADDYREASLVLADSAKASAALSRRCLQHVLREKGRVKPSNLDEEIQEVVPKLPSHLAGAVDAVRVIGNFAAHPVKSTSTGQIVDVEPGEAEWLLDVLEGLFDFYFVQPATLQRRRDTLNEKLLDAGKPPLK